MSEFEIVNRTIQKMLSVHSYGNSTLVVINNTVRIYECCYQMELGCCRDIWKITGKVENHPIVVGQIFCSSPKTFDEETLQFTTASGRAYQIMSL